MSGTSAGAKKGWATRKGRGVNAVTGKAKGKLPRLYESVDSKGRHSGAGYKVKRAVMLSRIRKNYKPKAAPDYGLIARARKSVRG